MNEIDYEECKEVLALLKKLDEKSKLYVLYMLLGANFAAEAEKQ